jgi:hypothetical protein
LSNGVQVNDVMRFFHGDGPAQQFEAGNSVGGNYCCVGCGVRGLSTAGKKKPALEKEFEDIRAGITNFPALLQNSPEASLHSLNLHQYEVSPTEPLHDLKGHFSNIIEESLLIATGVVSDEIKKIKKAVLTKEAVRCSDLRKAVILIYLKLKDLKPGDALTDLFRTAVDIANFCYAHDTIRSPRSILCLYNRAFLHAHQCSTLFPNPKSTTRRKMFGRYYHSLTVHCLE